MLLEVRQVRLDQVMYGRGCTSRNFGNKYNLGVRFQHCY